MFFLLSVSFANLCEIIVIRLRIIRPGRSAIGLLVIVVIGNTARIACVVVAVCAVWIGSVPVITSVSVAWPVAAEVDEDIFAMMVTPIVTRIAAADSDVRAGTGANHSPAMSAYTAAMSSYPS